MIRHRTRQAARGATVALALALTGALGGCAVAPGSGPHSDSTTDQEETTMSPVTVRSAVAASDPRITDVPTVQVDQSGLARVMTVAVVLSGDEPVSTDTVVNIAVAALQNATSDVDYLTLLAWAADDQSRSLDLSAAATGLPDGVDHRLTDSALELVGPDAAAIGGSR
ncbi:MULTISPECIES: hypothetical protein [unclassified Microbacterium]|uniref:hypothetical protein n=1 Tax=unclassified Microbacterium TaxID=2609290 RepID=UPI00214AD773|nr:MULTISPECIES: hypothetical protein [unclassified Microbacterium]MCR2784261.1 hypothetical protein [Microbacterium sp. zg.B96]MDL5350831.1 hypothetical protein [Microbacterium sp. zg-YB36]WIM14910.1 hypothetical protein QNO11_10120 [Microbacterium sp. zg-B96]